LTHHPPDWLAGDALARFRGEINPPGRFLAHYYGHMFDPKMTPVHERGGLVRREVQGAALYGHEPPQANTAAPRPNVHGYSASRLDVGPEISQLDFWPRWISAKTSSLALSAEPDMEHYSLDQRGMLRERLSVRRPDPRGARSVDAGRRKVDLWNELLDV